MNKKIAIILALLEILQKNLDEVELDGTVFKYSLKQKCKSFQLSLQENLKAIYRDLPEESQLVLFNEINTLEEGIETDELINSLS